MLEFFFGMFAGSVIVGGILEYRLDRREIDHLIALSEAKSDAFLDGFRHAAAGVVASDGKGFGAKTPIPSPMDSEREG